ncbi:GntR family transcriptional regulator [Pseudonocardia humida]|uniref:GntR family transcriptional regulator n=1 Tax=Pseudonocardia humida TaxID=2800819 RepID=A0ABT0ZXB0_9PSEU|nr:GntR family transcriptional regulator [Pseudonocardia humida]MCO1655356.1 GntR family transcriptional regulator [Pseudonocardia humida]
MHPPYRRTPAVSEEAVPFVAALGSTERSGAAVLAEMTRVILAGDAPPGMRIPQEEVAAVLGVSIVPVRESLKTLVGQGLVEHELRGGYTVARLTDAELQELYLVRGVLERAALEHAVARARPVDVECARRSHDALTAAMADGDDRAYHRDSRRFHLALVAPSGMARLQAMLESAWNLTEPYRPMSRLPRSEWDALHAEHDEMLRAFVDGDAAELVACAERHHSHLQQAVVGVAEAQ